VLGVSPGELAFVAMLVVMILLAQIAPRLGEAVALRLGGHPPVYDGGSAGSADSAGSAPKPPAPPDDPGSRGPG
jgi:hypothetical protein